MRGAFALSVAVVAVALALAGCGGDDGGDEGDLAAFCDKQKELAAVADPFADLGPGSTIDDIKGALDETQSAVDEAVDVAPSEIKGDAERLQSFFSDFADQVRGASSRQDLLRIAQTFQQEAAELQTAGSRLESYTRENC